MSLEPWRTGKVIQIQQQTNDTRSFFIQVPELTTLNFKPGQFVTLDLPIHEKPNKRWRSYSIASSPDGSNVFELIIVLDKNGTGTPYLFNEVTVGSELKFRGPQGVFTLKEPIDKDLVFICTGTGIAPFRSMLQYIKRNAVEHKNICLIFGCRTKASLLYYDEMKQLEQELKGFTYLPTLSREEWDGQMGYVHPVYESLCADRRPAEFYLCGWKGMIDDARKRIADMGYDKKEIHYEIYG
ncbi:FAD-binding oxidoreductase [Ferruginibacter paludis]|uniref:ferredoxin--NADP reductase n=1 Tax=Ferruginibacter paludis TaxID=1310417 RepID=UPI0025B36E6A|nr:FAD-binding oxidoreductase [Ferruginibacter paludis]MDN3658555.1 FAD-binding oxidoreductase [Ferruginibacter paludis]